MNQSAINLLSASVQQVLDENFTDRSPGMVVSVSFEGQILLEQAVGLANVTTGQQINAQTNFRMASVSKQFTAMAVALLEHEGLLSFETSLAAIFPEVGAIGQNVTLRHLLTHTSGLPDYETFMDETRPEQVQDTEMLQLLATQPTLYFTPGTRFWYSNTGYVLLGLVVEKISQMPFASFLRQRIFAPLGMTTTTLYQPNNPDAVINNRAMGYTSLAPGQFIFSDQSTYSATQGDGCLYTSLQEYRLWHQALQSNVLLPLEPLLENVQAPVQAGRQGWSGMGWFFARRQSGGLELYHTGNTCGFSHLVVRIPEQNILVTAFSNLADAPMLPDVLKAVLCHAPFQLENDLVWALPSLTR